MDNKLIIEPVIEQETTKDSSDSQINSGLLNINNYEKLNGNISDTSSSAHG